MDNAQAAGDDLLDITSATSSARSTDNIITLNSPFNIDDTAAKHLFDGSVIQTNGDEIYDGIVCFAAAGTYLTIIQNGKILSPNFWTTGLNADAANGVSHKFMIKTRTAAADIDGRRIVGQTREFGLNYSEFKINGTARGNNVLALTAATDLNNGTAAATAKTWTTILNTEGYNQLDVNNDTVLEPYYSQWDRAAFTVNQLYERAKWLSRRATSESSGADTGTSFKIGDGTILGQSQSFANGVVPAYLTRVFCNLNKVGTPTGNLVAKIYAHSGTFGTSSIPTGTALATSKNIDVAQLTTVYQTVEIGFDTQFLMLASTNYTISFEFTGTSANYAQVQGLAATGTAAGNRAQLVTTTWTATATDDLNFDVHASPKLYGITGELFRGVTQEVALGAMGTLATTGASGTGATATITFAAQPVAIPVGTLINIAGVTPAGYNQTGASVTASTTTSVSYANTTTGAQTVAGTVLVYFNTVEPVSWAGGTLPFNASVTITRVSATATVAHTAHGLKNGQKVVISGATQPEYNGIQTLANVTANTYDYTVTGTPATPATGTIVSTAVILDGLTDVNGVIQDTAFNFSSNQPVSGRARRSTTSPLYKTATISGTITTAGFINNVFMVADE